jgi:hypothetical protein
MYNIFTLLVCEKNDKDINTAPLQKKFPLHSGTKFKLFDLFDKAFLREEQPVGII